MVKIETMGRPCGKELGSGVHILWRKNDRRSRFGVLENVMYVRLDGGGALHNGGRTVRRCLKGAMEMGTLALSISY